MHITLRAWIAGFELVCACYLLHLSLFILSHFTLRCPRPKHPPESKTTPLNTMKNA